MRTGVGQNVQLHVYYLLRSAYRVLLPLSNEFSSSRYCSSSRFAESSLRRVQLSLCRVHLPFAVQFRLPSSASRLLVQPRCISLSLISILFFMSRTLSSVVSCDAQSVLCGRALVRQRQQRLVPKHGVLAQADAGNAAPIKQSVSSQVTTPSLPASLAPVLRAQPSTSHTLTKTHIESPVPARCGSPARSRPTFFFFERSLLIDRAAPCFEIKNTRVAMLFCC